MTTSIAEKKHAENWIFTLSAIVMTMFLFFIDGGYYNFKWMNNIGNWIVFPFYALPILGGQLFMHHVILKRQKGLWKRWLTIVVGITIGIFFTVYAIF